MASEKWAEINIPGYYISSYGSLRKKLKNGRWRYLTPGHDRDGYQRTAAGGKTQFIHRLVAQAFIPNPQHLPQVNHINGNKDDNRAENLEWISPSGNMFHAYTNLPNRVVQAVVSIEKTPPYKMKIYPSINQAHRATGAGSKEISQAIQSWDKQPDHPLSAKGVWWHRVDASEMR